MTITIRLTPEDEEALRERASLSGQGVADYVQRVISRHIHAPATLAEILAPVRRQFAESGMSEDELDALVEDAREEVWREKQAGRAEAP